MTQTRACADNTAFDRFYKRLRNQTGRALSSRFGVKAAEAAVCVPDFAYLLCKLMGDPEVPAGRKLDFLGSVLYVISPIDLFPDKLPLLGALDDVYVSVMAVCKLLQSTERHVLMRYWLSEPRTLDNLRSWLAFFDMKFGTGLLKTVVSYIKS